MIFRLLLLTLIISSFLICYRNGYKTGYKVGCLDFSDAITPIDNMKLLNDYKKMLCN